jgi:hypothetical protein
MATLNLINGPALCVATDELCIKGAIIADKLTIDFYMFLMPMVKNDRVIFILQHRCCKLGVILCDHLSKAVIAHYISGYIE